MSKRRSSQLMLVVTLVLSLIQFQPILTSHTQESDLWWDDDWPYRVSVIPMETGALEANLNFSQLFAHLGINGALLDLRSVRVVAYQDGLPIGPIPYEEAYSTKFIDTGILNTDGSLGTPYWFDEKDITFTLDAATPKDQPTIHALIDINSGSSYETGFTYEFNNGAGVNWTEFETMIYEVYPQVNDSAIDQTPDLYKFELGGILGCITTEIGGPALAMGRWNTVSVSLVPYGNCPEPDPSSLDYLRFFVNVYQESQGGENYGYYVPGDQVNLWLDNFRLVDQDNGILRWNAVDGADKYYVYFDTLNHEGHPLPELAEIDASEFSQGNIGSAEAGGYYHQITGSTIENLIVWHAPNTEKITQDHLNPTPFKPLQIKAARGELEAFQLIIRSTETRYLNILVSNLVHSNGTSVIAAENVELFRVDYVDLSQISDFYGRIGLWPDPLYPILPESEISLQINTNQPLWFRIRVPNEAKPGIYEGRITIGSAIIPFSLEVWDFVLPDTAFLDSKFGFNWNMVMETYGGTIAGEPQPCLQDLENAIQSTFNDYHLVPSEQNVDGFPDGIALYSLTAYEITKAQSEFLQSGTPIWWQFDENVGVDLTDYPPLPNPSVIDRAGTEARILPWLAWLDRVDGFFYPQTVDWDNTPWDTPFSNGLTNGNRFFFYPPKDNSLGFDPCIPQSNRLVPSIRLELLREGMEDYAYLLLLNGEKPQVGALNPVDDLIDELLPSRTAFTRIPTALDALRADLASQIITNRKSIYLPILLH